MDNKFEKYKSAALWLGIPVLIGVLLWNSYPTQDFVGRWMDFVDSQRRQHLHEVLEKKSDDQLLRLIHHGDLNVSGVATTELGKRANPALFGRVEKKLRDFRKDVRERARVLLAALDRERAIKVYMKQLHQLKKNSDEYQQTLAILSNLKYQPVYPYLVEYSKSGPDGYGWGSAKMFANLGNPEALPWLKEQLAKTKGNDTPANLHRQSLEEAIATLEKIAAEDKVKKE